MIKYEKTREETKQNKENTDRCIDRLNQSMQEKSVAHVLSMTLYQFNRQPSIDALQVQKESKLAILTAPV